MPYRKCPNCRIQIHYRGPVQSDEYVLCAWIGQSLGEDCRWPDIPGEHVPEHQCEAWEAARLAKNQAAKALIQEWLDDESGYDERTWPLLQAQEA